MKYNCQYLLKIRLIKNFNKLSIYLVCIITFSVSNGWPTTIPAQPVERGFCNVKYYVESFDEWKLFRFTLTKKKWNIFWKLTPDPTCNEVMPIWGWHLGRVIFEQISLFEINTVKWVPITRNIKIFTMDTISTIQSHEAL